MSGVFKLGHVMNAINYLDHWPKELETAAPTDLFALLKKPTIIHLEGKRRPPLVISTLLHGNETTGYLALQQILKTIGSKDLPRSLIILLGNVEAAAQGKRHLPSQNDFNRIWGTDHPVATEITQFLESTPKMAIIDIHNNTGRNPHYACVSDYNPETLHLGLLFSRNLVFFREPASTFSIAMGDKNPSIVLECGRSADSFGLEHTTNYLMDLMRLDHLPNHPPPSHDMNIYEMQMALRIPQDSSVGIGDERADFCFLADLDQMNFIPSSEQRLIGYRRDESLELLQVETLPSAEAGTGVQYRGKEIWLNPSWVPSMFTLDKKVMKSDCLGYLMRSRGPA
jgi:hypothetical protein